MYPAYAKSPHLAYAELICVNMPPQIHTHFTGKSSLLLFPMPSAQNEMRTQTNMVYGNTVTGIFQENMVAFSQEQC